MSPRARERLRPFALWLALGLAQFGGLALAAHFFPGGYDWRRDVISQLSEPRFNPHAYGIACVGLALTGLFLLPFPTLLQRRLPATPRGLLPWTGRVLRLGATLLILAACIPGHQPGLGRTHETLAEAFGVALSVATTGYCCAALVLPRHFLLQRYAGLVLILIPLAGFLVSRLALLGAYEFISVAAFHELLKSIWNSLALWEWIAAAGTYLLLGLLVLTLPETTGPINQVE